MEKRKEQESFMHGKIRKNKKESKENEKTRCED